MSEVLTLDVENLSFRYRHREEFAIRDISLSMGSGELVLIAGPSGCGKTTLARCVNGLAPRSYKGELKGSVRLQDQDTSGIALSKISQMVGTVLQDPDRQILGTKVFSEVAFGLENLRMERQEILARVEETMEYLGIAQLRDRDTHSLSGGEKQKIALAGVLAMRPNLLLLDEPLASLDPASAQEALNLLRRLVDEGLSVLIVEHRVENVLKISPDKVMLMELGRVSYYGEASGLEHAADYREVKLPARMVMKLAGAAGAVPEPRLRVNEPEAEPAELVQFEDVSFEYTKGVEVLHDVNLVIRRGDIIGVLGPNAAGKTTLIKHAIGLLKPKSGTVMVEGKNTHELTVAEIASTLGYVFQSPSHMLFAPSVSEELAFGPTNLEHSPEQIEKEVKEAIDIVNLSGMEDDPPLALSFGQQKRVTIAAILAMRSKILVMDEPTAGQDYKNYMDFMDAIVRLPNFEAILFITHDIDLAVVYANRVILVDHGTIVADGAPYQIMKDYQTLLDSRLLPTSLLDANLEVFEQSQKFLRAEALAHYFPTLD
ncbi:MAG: ABC transporter ATP-binding protein [Chloroflexi bacterium]|nr:ABC transporter ATP-binding protein [Chloroflexota bacterium]